CAAPRGRADRRSRLRQRRGRDAPPPERDATRRRRRRRHARSTTCIVGRPRRVPARRPCRRPDEGAARPGIAARCERSAMSAVAHPSPLSGPANGGASARRAVIRWAARMFRREWRQQLLVLVLLMVAVTAAIGSIAVLHSADAGPSPVLGTGNRLFTLDG